MSPGCAGHSAITETGRGDGSRPVAPAMRSRSNPASSTLSDSGRWSQKPADEAPAGTPPVRLSCFVRRWRSGAARRSRISPSRPFVEAEIASLEELRLAAHEELIEAELALGRHADVVAELRGPRTTPSDAGTSASPADARLTGADARPKRCRRTRTSDGCSRQKRSSRARHRDLERAILHQDVALAPAARPAAHTPRALRSRRLLYAAAAAAVVSSRALSG